MDAQQKQKVQGYIQNAVSRGVLEEYAPGKYRITEKGKAVLEETKRRKRKPSDEKGGAAKAVYDFIAAFIEKNGYSPTYREISDELKIAVSYVSSIVESLVSRGYLEHKRAKARTIKLTGKSL